MQDIPEVPKKTKESHDYWDDTVSYESTPESVWWFHYMSERCNKLVSEILGTNMRVLEDSYKLIRIGSGGLPPHDDGGQSKISCIVYLEVPEVGGELIFTKQRKSVKPEKDLLVFFPNTDEYTHMVDVFIGNRLVFITYLI